MTKYKTRDSLLTAFLLLILVTGIFCRYFNMDWDSEALLHPDEYGLTNTLTRLQIPASIGEYFNTRISSLSPYNKYGITGEKIADGPDNTMRWGQLPMTILRLCAEMTNNTGYIELRRMGRYVNATMDVLSLFLLYLIGKRLFNRIPALVGCALSALCVQQIQQAHFMTVDNFAVFFTMLTLYTTVCLAQESVITRNESGFYHFSKRGWSLLLRFGIFLGMAIACKVNLAVLGVVLAPAMWIQIADLKLTSKQDFSRVITLVLLSVLIAIGAMAVSVRIFQPMSFRAETGNTSFFTWHFNPDWIRSMGVAANESQGIGGGPPSEQWAHRPPILFALVNQVFYGMGAPLGIAVWVCVVFAWIRIFRGENWKQWLIPAFWGSFFFLFMSTRFVKNNRYFLPAYPMLCLVTSACLCEWIRKSRKKTFPLAVSLLIFSGTAVWTGCFVRTIYGQLHSRVEAVEWMYANIPGLFQLNGKNGGMNIPAWETEELPMDFPWTRNFTPYRSLEIDELVLPHASSASGNAETLNLRIEILDSVTQEPLMKTDAEVEIPAEETELHIPLKTTALKADWPYTFSIRVTSGSGLHLRRTVLANENWDEGLPFRLHGIDPFGQIYTGITNEVRWYDSDEKLEMFVDRLSQADYLIVPSQRGLWSVCRIPKTYPMTMGYYDALFKEQLGFELVAAFQRPFRIGPLTISDLAGTISTAEVPDLPVDNRSVWAAEEAFSVYDHPPVWIFKKTADFSTDKLREFLSQYDLSQVVVQGPRDAEW